MSENRIVYDAVPVRLVLHRPALISRYADVIGTTPAEMLGECREKSLVRKRWAAWIVLRRDYGMSYPQIAKWFARDHTTVLYGFRQAEKRWDEIAYFVEIFRSVAQQREIEPEICAHAVEHTAAHELKLSRSKARKVAKKVARSTPRHRASEALFLAVLRSEHPDHETLAYRRAA